MRFLHFNMKPEYIIIYDGNTLGSKPTLQQESRNTTATKKNTSKYEPKINTYYMIYEKLYIYIYLLLVRIMKICEKAKYDLIKWTMLTKSVFLMDYERVF